MWPSQRTCPVVLDLPSTLPTVFHAHDMNLHADGDLDLSDIPPSGEIDVSSSLQAEFTVIHSESVEYLAEALTTAVRGLK